jgi:hypothetical protein
MLRLVLFPQLNEPPRRLPAFLVSLEDTRSCDETASSHVMIDVMIY